MMQNANRHTPLVVPLQQVDHLLEVLDGLEHTDVASGLGQLKQWIK